MQASQITMLYKFALSFGAFGCVSAFIAFLDLVNYDNPRHVPTEIFWFGIGPLVLAFLLLPFLLVSDGSIAKRVGSHGAKLDKTMKDQIAVFKAATERHEIESDDPASKEYEDRLLELQRTLAYQSEYTATAIKKMRLQTLKVYAAFGLALGVVITRMLVDI